MRRVFSNSVSVLGKLTRYSAAALLVLALSTTLVILNSGDDDFQFSAADIIVNDITRLNPVRVGRITRPTSIDEISHAIADTTGPISIGGGHFSQGGQTAYRDSQHFDMRSFNKILELDVAAREITVQAGATWRQLQEYIDPHGLSISIMQTYANFTVGGSLSVNVHGRYVGAGPLVYSVRSIKMVLADGSVVTASPALNSDIFYGAIGGYGGLGVIVEATLQLSENRRIERRVSRMPVSEYHDYFFDNIRDNPEIVLHNADVYPPHYTTLRQVSWYKTDKALTIAERLIPTDREYFWEPKVAGFVADYDAGKWLREHVLEPIYYARDRVVWRNWEASYDIRELEPDDRGDYAYGLREYFVPVAALDDFVPKMRDIFNRHEANILNVSIRHAKADPGSLLAWAREEVFALVVYYRQATSRAEQAKVDAWSADMIDAVIATGGTYYLPYQNSASPAQFQAAYPRHAEFFALKRRLDPANRFQSQMWAKYMPDDGDALDAERAKISDYYRGEEQTFLTIPEWYLVFNPTEYADYLEAGGNPSAFPFFASIDEYWTLYDRVRTIADACDYPPNSEYLSMLRVIGISTTVEYMLKATYETTIGRFTRWTADGVDTAEDTVMQRAHRAYSDLIYAEPWYKFPFWSWVRTMWRDTDVFGRHFIRKTERKLYFSLEFGIKSLYAKLIGYAAESTYGESEDTIYVSARVNGDSVPRLPSAAHALFSREGRYLLSVPRWGGFTKTMPALADAGFEFDDVSGNRWIAATVITARPGAVSFDGATQLFTSRVVSNDAQLRLVLLVPVRRVADFIRSVRAAGGRLEHLYDY